MPSILANFTTMHKALQAKQELLDESFDTVQVDRISEYPTEPNSYFNNPIASQAAGLSGITQIGGYEFPSNVRPLAAADIASSGMSNGENGLIGPNILLTVVTSDELLDKAMKIIENNEGQV